MKRRLRNAPAGVPANLTYQVIASGTKQSVPCGPPRATPAPSKKCAVSCCYMPQKPVSRRESRVSGRPAKRAAIPRSRRSRRNKVLLYGETPRDSREGGRMKPVVEFVKTIVIGALSADTRPRLAWAHPSSSRSQTGSALDGLLSHPSHQGRVLLTPVREALPQVLRIDP